MTHRDIHPRGLLSSAVIASFCRCRPPDSEDPWRKFECDGGPEGSSVTFEDPDYARFGRDTVYSVRAIEASKPGINAGGIRCERELEENCIKATLCEDASGKDNCLADHEPRAWSSPIFLDWSR